jgi:hypothetical protein
MTRTDAHRLRAVNPDFMILHYRLGLGLGHRAAEGDCQPTGDWLQILDGSASNVVGLPPRCVLPHPSE